MVKSKLLSGITATLLAAGIFTTVAVGSAGFRNWNVGTWFRGETQGETGKADFSGVQGSDGQEYASGNVYALPTAVTFSLTSLESSVASEGVRFEVTVNATGEADKSVDWTAAWKNAGSEWVGDKAISDYFTVTPDGDGAVCATFYCLQPFGEQVEVTVTSRQNPAAKLICTVDFAQRVESAVLKLGDSLSYNLSEDHHLAFLGNMTGGQGGELTLDYTLSEVYTLAQEFTPNVTFVADVYSKKFFRFQYYLGGGQVIGLNYNLPQMGQSYYLDCRFFRDLEFRSGTFCSSVSEMPLWVENDVPNFERIERSVNGNLPWVGSTVPLKVLPLWRVNVSIAGEHTTHTYASNFYIDSITNYVSSITGSDHVVI